MTPAEIAALTAPLSEEEPCGPDLEMLGDPDYMRFTARIDAVLPKTFASFDRASIDFPAEFATLKDLLAKSRDLRLLAPLAKLHILNRDLAGYTAVFKLIEGLLDGAWPSIVPALIDGDAVLRVVTLQTLDDMADSVMPLQSAPLFETRRFGKVSYRTHLLANGLIQPRAPQNDGEAGEEVPSAGAVNGALAEADVTALIAARTQAIELQECLGRIEALLGEKSGQPGALAFDRLKPLVRDISGFLDKSVAQRDPSLGLATTAPTGSSTSEDGANSSGALAGAVGVIQSTAQAQGALAAAATYFTRSEPSSPILLLIGQAQALVGRSFFEVMQALLPDEASKARLRVGQDPAFVMYVERLAGLSLSQAEQDGGHEMVTPSEDAEQTEQGEEAAQSEEAEPSADQAEATEAGGNGEEEQPPAAVAAPAPVPSEFRADDRRTAMALLQQAAAHFRRAEPSSPIPLLLDRAEAFAGRDFFGLLRETLPADSLKVDEQPG